MIDATFDQPIDLSEGEKRVLALVACGLSGVQIAEIVSKSASYVSRRINIPIRDLQCPNVAVLMVTVLSTEPSIMDDARNQGADASFSAFGRVVEALKADPLSAEELAYLNREVTKYSSAVANEWAVLRPPPLARQILQRLKTPKVHDRLLLIVAAASCVGQLESTQFHTGYRESVRIEEVGATITVTGPPGVRVTLQYNGLPLYLGIQNADV
jgi:hypothetical protein